MGQKETKVTDLCSELAITRQTLYRHLAPDGTLRKDRLKIVEGGKIRYGRSTSGHAGVSLQTLADAEKGKHACKDQNECKGQGGCKTSDAGCKGKKSCKGKGCATDGTKPPQLL